MQHLIKEVLMISFICVNIYLRSSEVEVAKLLGSDNHSVGCVGPWCHPVKLVLRLTSDQVKVLLAEPAVRNLILISFNSLHTFIIILNLNVGGSVVSHIVHVVLHHDVHPFH